MLDVDFIGCGQSSPLPCNVPNRLTDEYNVDPSLLPEHIVSKSNSAEDDAASSSFAVQRLVIPVKRGRKPNALFLTSEPSERLSKDCLPQTPQLTTRQRLYSLKSDLRRVRNEALRSVVHKGLPTVPRPTDAYENENTKIGRLRHIVNLHANMLHIHKMKPLSPDNLQPVDFTCASHSVSFVGPLRRVVQEHARELKMMVAGLAHRAEWLRYIDGINDTTASLLAFETQQEIPVVFGSITPALELMNMLSRRNYVREWKNGLEDSRYRAVEAVLRSGMFFQKPQERERRVKSTQINVRYCFRKQADRQLKCF